MTLNLDFTVTGLLIDAVDVLCAQLTRDLFAIAKFLLFFRRVLRVYGCTWVTWEAITATTTKTVISHKSCTIVTES